jgi:CBS domain-containing protein
MLVREVMETEVTAVAPETTIDRVAQLMADLDVGALPVGPPGGRPQGIITGRDILLRVVAPGRDPRAMRAADAMSSDLVCCAPEDDGAAVLREMERRQIRRMPVIDGEGRLAGVVTEADLHRASLREAAGDKPRFA